MADFDDEDLDFDALDPEGESDDEPEDPKVLRERLRAEREAREAAEAAAARERDRADEWLRGVHSREANNTRQTQQPLGPMPDPVKDYEAFARWQAEKDARAQAELDARLAARDREEEQREAARAEGVKLWERFREKYPSLASREALAGAAYRELNASGRLPQGTEAIVDAVRAEMTRLAGGKTASRAAGTTPDAARPRARRPGSEAVIPSMSDTILKRKQELGLI